MDGRRLWVLVDLGLEWQTQLVQQGAVIIVSKIAAM